MEPFSVDWDALWRTVQVQFRGHLMGIHGLSHWRQVERNGLMLAERNCLPADAVLIVRLFAALHDSQRVNDCTDDGHGQRAAVYARQVNSTLFNLSADGLKVLEKACARHELGETTLDLVIGTCWDADRLDLVRIGATPRKELMNTPAGKALAR